MFKAYNKYIKKIFSEYIKKNGSADPPKISFITPPTKLWFRH